MSAAINFNIFGTGYKCLRPKIIKKLIFTKIRFILVFIRRLFYIKKNLTSNQ